MSRALTLNPATIADGARTAAPGEITFPLIMQYVADRLTVDDAELLRTMWYLWERLKIVVEPTGALGARPHCSKLSSTPAANEQAS